MESPFNELREAKAKLRSKLNPEPNTNTRAPRAEAGPGAVAARAAQMTPRRSFVGLLLLVSGSIFGGCLGLLGGCWGLFGTVWDLFDDDGTCRS